MYMNEIFKYKINSDEKLIYKWLSDKNNSNLEKVDIIELIKRRLKNNLQN